MARVRQKEGTMANFIIMCLSFLKIHFKLIEGMDVLGQITERDADNNLMLQR